MEENTMTYIKHLIIAVSLCLTFNCLALNQEESPIRDTIAQISAQENGLHKLLEQQKEGSIKRVELENKLISIKLDDNKEKQGLLNEITILKNRDSLMYAKRKQKVDSLRSLNRGVPVIPFKDTLFIIYNQIGSYSVAERASAIGNRIHALADNFKFSPDSLRLIQNESDWIIFWNDQMIASVNDQDALWANITTEQLAKSYFKKIKNAIQEYRNETSLKKISSEIASAFAIIAAVSLIIFHITKFTKWIKLNISTNRTKYFSGITIKGYELISSTRQLKITWTIIAILKWLLILVCIYLALPLILNLFPSTEGYAPLLVDYVVDPIKKLILSIVNYLPNLVTIIIISIVFRYVLKILKYFAKELENGKLTIQGFYQDWAMPTYQILRVLLLAFYLIVVFPYFPGSDTPIFKGVSVFIGVLLTFSSTGPIGNIIAGLLITYMRSFSVGDRIKIGEVSGDIIEKTLLVTRIRTIKNEVISIPNSQILNSHTINYSAALILILLSFTRKSVSVTMFHGKRFMN